MQNWFCRSYPFEFQISGAIELVKITVAVSGVVDPDSGMITDLAELDHHVQGVLQKLKSASFASSQMLSEKTHSELGSHYNDLQIQCEILSQRQDCGVRIAIAGETRYFEMRPMEKQKVDSTQLLSQSFANFTDFIQALEQNNWQGEIFDPMQNMKLEIKV